MRFLVEVSWSEGRRLDGGVRWEGDHSLVPFCGIVELIGVLEAFLDGFDPRQGPATPGRTQEGALEPREHADRA